MVLEVGAARLSIERGARGALSDADFAPLTAILNLCDQPLGQAEWERAGSEFHVALARLSGNAFLARGVEDAMTRLARARWLSASDEAARADARNDHRAIFAAVRDGDAAPRGTAHRPAQRSQDEAG